MKILILGNDARCHCIAWKLYQSEFVKTIFSYPGNPGIFKFCRSTDIKEDSFAEIFRFCEKKGIEIIIPGPEKYIVDGIYDYMKERKIKVFGPSKEAAKLEGSKHYAKRFMKKYNIPTADYERFENNEELVHFISYKAKFPLVVKADGLAAGKGVKVCLNKQEALQHIEKMKDIKDINGKDGVFIVEQFLCGKEASLLCFVDGRTILPMIYSQDHKRALDGDKGQNTGGMGAFSNPEISEKTRYFIKKNIVENTLTGIKKEKLDYKGVLFIGLMINNDKAWVIEYNVRFGDPETQSILPLMQSDLGQIVRNSFKKDLANTEITWEDRQSVCVVCASGGYPGTYEKGIEIDVNTNMKSLLFYSQVKDIDNRLYTDGGRIMSVVGKGKTVEEARKNAYTDIKKIKFKGMYYRKDIAESKR